MEVTINQVILHLLDPGASRSEERRVGKEV